MPKISEKKKITQQILVRALRKLAAVNTVRVAVALGRNQNNVRRLLPIFHYISNMIIGEAVLKLHWLDTTRYINGRTRSIPKPEEPTLVFALRVYKSQCPDQFRNYFRLTPQTFDLLVEVLSQNPVFYNNSSNEQTPIELQIAVTLYRLGHNGNAVSLTKTGIACGLGHGTVHLITQRVIQAIYATSFRKVVMRPPTEEEKEASRRWAESKSCPAWRNGWCGVDGTNVPLYERPMLHGTSYYDRKSNYSSNVQVRCSLLASFIALSNMQSRWSHSFTI
jgi:hypothetical protein